MKTIFIILLVYFTTLILSASEIKLDDKEKEWIKNHPTITLGTDVSWAPFIVKKDGFTTGYDKDVLALINERTGANFQLVTGTWKEMVEKAINKEIDGLSTSAVHKDREKYFNFSDTYTSTQKYLITLDSNPKDIYTADDYAGKRIAYHQDNLFDIKLLAQYKNSILVPFSSIEEQLAELVDRKVDFILGHYEIFLTAEKKSYLI